MSVWEKIIGDAGKKSPSRGMRIKSDSIHSKEWKQVASFEGLPTIANLKVLDVRRTGISSFFGAEPQPSLERFNCLETPLAQYKYLPLMSLIAFGKSVSYVNGNEVDIETRRIANSIKSDLRSLICNDKWVIVHVNPVKMLHITTRKRKTYFTEKPKTDTDDLDVLAVAPRPVESSDSSTEEAEVKKEEKPEPVPDSFSVAAYVGTDEEIRAYLRELTTVQVEERTRTRNRQMVAFSVTTSLVSRDVESILGRTEVQNQYAESVIDRRPAMFRSPDKTARSVLSPTEFGRTRSLTEREDLYPPSPVNVGRDYMDERVSVARSPEKRPEVDVSTIRRHVRKVDGNEWEKESRRSRRSRRTERTKRRGNADAELELLSENEGDEKDMLSEGSSSVLEEKPPKKEVADDGMSSSSATRRRRRKENDEGAVSDGSRKSRSANDDAASSASMSSSRRRRGEKKETEGEVESESHLTDRDYSDAPQPAKPTPPPPADEDVSYSDAPQPAKPAPPADEDGYYTDEEQPTKPAPPPPPPADEDDYYSEEPKAAKPAPPPADDDYYSDEPQVAKPPPPPPADNDDYYSDEPKAAKPAAPPPADDDDYYSEEPQPAKPAAPPPPADEDDYYSDEPQPAKPAPPPADEDDYYSDEPQPAKPAPPPPADDYYSDEE